MFLVRRRGSTASPCSTSSRSDSNPENKAAAATIHRPPLRSSPAPPAACEPADCPSPRCRRAAVLEATPHAPTRRKRHRPSVLSPPRRRSRRRRAPRRSWLSCSSVRPGPCTPIVRPGRSGHAGGWRWVLPPIHPEKTGEWDRSVLCFVPIAHAPRRRRAAPARRRGGTFFKGQIQLSDPAVHRGERHVQLQLLLNLSERGVGMIRDELPELRFDLVGEFSFAAAKVEQRVRGSALAMILPHAANG